MCLVFSCGMNISLCHSKLYVVRLLVRLYLFLTACSSTREARAPSSRLNGQNTGHRLCSSTYSMWTKDHRRISLSVTRKADWWTHLSALRNVLSCLVSCQDPCSFYDSHPTQPYISLAPDVWSWWLGVVVVECSWATGKRLTCEKWACTQSPQTLFLAPWHPSWKREALYCIVRYWSWASRPWWVIKAHMMKGNIISPLSRIHRYCHAEIQVKL